MTPLVSLSPSFIQHWPLLPLLSIGSQHPITVLPIQNGASEHQTAEQSTRTRLLRINIVSVSHDRQEQSTDLKNSSENGQKKSEAESEI